MSKKNKMQQYLNSCKSCWWQEGGLCYCKDREGFEQIKKEIYCYSNLNADKKCDHYTNKRKVYEQYLPPEFVVIVSEEKQKEKRKQEYLKLKKEFEEQ